MRRRFRLLKMVDDADIMWASSHGATVMCQMTRVTDKISVTEMEYNRAKERDIPRLIFIAHDDHPVKAKDVEKGEGAEKLEAFKKRVGAENIVNFFKSPEDLRAQMIHGLSQHRISDLTNLHSLVALDIPEAPKPYIAHPYTLLQTSQLVGRNDELNLLTDWVAKPRSPIYQAHILNIVAIGGMGKSALTWKWFNDIAPLEMKPLAGQMWWSFYESDARFENFVIRALAYVSKRPREEVEKMPPSEREAALLNILNEQPFLLVLDGLERILIAYSGMNAAYLADDELDKKTANYVAQAVGLPESAGQSFVGQHQLRKTADPRAGQFLRKLANVKAARILVSTRLYPSELQTNTGNPVPRSSAIFVNGLHDDDALALWRAMGVSGSRDTLLPLFKRFDNYPLLIRALAGLVANYKRAPGDFDVWREHNPDFNPLTLPLVQVKSHVLQFALAGLDEEAIQVLRTVAAFRMPAGYDTLASLLVENLAKSDDSDDKSGEEGGSRTAPTAPKPFASENELDTALVELEDRGLLGWDKAANRYDLHPIVRGATWDALNTDDKRGVYETLHTHFEAVPDKFGDDYTQVNSLEDLAPAIELYNTLIGLGRYDDACGIFQNRFGKAMFYRLAANHQLAEMLEMLFPEGLRQPPRLQSPTDQAFTLNALSLAYHNSGQPGRAVSLSRRDMAINEVRNEMYGVSITLGNLSYMLRVSGGLREAEFAARRSLAITRELENHEDEASTLNELGLVLALRGKTISEVAQIALQRALRIDEIKASDQAKGVDITYLTQVTILWEDYVSAHQLADQAWKLAHIQRNERDFISAAQLQGEAALGLNDLVTADERLHHALTRARAVNLVEEELSALIALAELARRQGEPDKAQERLDEVWEAAERGPYPLIHADALNVLAQIERDAGNTEAAINAATEAYQKAWCDGISADGTVCYAYWWGLQKAKAHLEALGAAIPVLEPFDESKFEPLPEVEINPDDEFHVEEDDPTP